MTQPDGASAATLRDEGDARWLREGCECERRGVPEAAECLYESPCPDERRQAAFVRELYDAATGFCLYVGHRPCAKYPTGEPCCIERGDEQPCPPCWIGKVLAEVQP